MNSWQLAFSNRFDYGADDDIVLPSAANFNYCGF